MVLGAYRPAFLFAVVLAVLSQYTVWCWVLIDPKRDASHAIPVIGLNTPCGAGCLSTRTSHIRKLTLKSQYTVWCWVLIDRRGREAADVG